MRLERSDLWDAPADLYVVTTNGVVTKRGLIMGKGSALQMAQRKPSIPRIAGERLSSFDFDSKTTIFDDVVYVYGFMGFLEEKAGIFQTKFHWKLESYLPLIEASCNMMGLFIEQHGLQNVRMNFPGIGLGGLKKEDVLPIVQSLPDSVVIVDHT